MSNEFRDIEKELYEKTRIPIEIGEMSEEYKKKFGSKYHISMWFNDMFGWAVSWSISFVPKEVKTIDGLLEKFWDWYDKGGKIILDKFDDVKYPNEEEDTYEDDLDNYFLENCKIGCYIEDSINKYCGHDLNDDFNREEIFKEKK